LHLFIHVINLKIEIKSNQIKIIFIEPSNQETKYKL